MKYKHVKRLFETCAKNQPVYEPLDRVQASLRQTSSLLVQRKKKQSKSLSPIFNLLMEVGGLINKLEQRMYCFMTELQRTKTNSIKYKSLWELYHKIKPNVTKVMQISTYIAEEQDSEQVSNEFLWNSYLSLLQQLRPIGYALLQFFSVKQNVETLNYLYQYETGTKVPTCFSKSYPQVIELMSTGRSNAQINQRKYELISHCLEKKKILPECVELYDSSVASGSRDVFIAQAFMRIQLLIKSLQKERSKVQVVKALEQQIQKQEIQIDDKIFRTLKEITEGNKVRLLRKRVVLENRKCITKQQQETKKQQNKQQETKQQQNKQQQKQETKKQQNKQQEMKKQKQQQNFM
jgi:hypothetical protein